VPGFLQRVVCALLTAAVSTNAIALTRKRLLVNSPVGSNHLNYQGKATANRGRGQGGLQECLGSAYLLF
jgi:hypothetical protein